MVLASDAYDSYLRLTMPSTDIDLSFLNTLLTSAQTCAATLGTAIDHGLVFAMTRIVVDC